MFEVIESILRELEVLGFKAVCAGGCLRDYQWGVNPKDIDIFIYEEKTGADWGKMTELFDAEVIVEAGKHVESGAPTDYRCNGRHIVNELIKFNRLGFNIDIISFNDPTPDAQSVVRLFDFKMNTSLMYLNAKNERVIKLVNPYDMSPVHLAQIDEDRFRKMCDKIYDRILELKPSISAKELLYEHNSTRRV